VTYFPHGYRGYCERKPFFSSVTICYGVYPVVLPSFDCLLRHITTSHNLPIFYDYQAFLRWWVYLMVPGTGLEPVTTCVEGFSYHYSFHYLKKNWSYFRSNLPFKQELPYQVLYKFVVWTVSLPYKSARLGLHWIAPPPHSCFTLNSRRLCLSCACFRYFPYSLYTFQTTMFQSFL
jgi:hypothetical protein